MMKRFAVLTVIAVLLGAVPAAFAQGGGGGGSGGGSGGSTGGGAGAGGSSPGGSGAGGTGGSNNPGLAPAPGTSPGAGTQQQAPGSGAIQSDPGRSSTRTAPGMTGESRPIGPIDNTAEAATALRSRGYSDVQELVRSGDVYRGRALRNGRTVMIEMDARTGAVRETGG